MTSTHQPSRVFQGTVESTKMQKTLLVRVDRTKVHPRYKKRYTISRKYPVHNEQGTYQVGDVVTFCETRPMSRTKRWRVLGKVVKK